MRLRWRLDCLNATLFASSSTPEGDGGRNGRNATLSLHRLPAGANADVDFSLCYNDIDGEGARALAAAFPSCKELTKIKCATQHHTDLLIFFGF